MSGFKCLYHKSDLNVDTAQELHQMFVEGQDETAFYESLISKQQEKRAEIDQKINEKINVGTLFALLGNLFLLPTMY